MPAAICGRTEKIERIFNLEAMALEDWDNSQPICILITEEHILEAASKVAGLPAVRRLSLLPSTVRPAEPGGEAGFQQEEH